MMHGDRPHMGQSRDDKGYCTDRPDVGEKILRRIIAVALVRNSENRYLICKKPAGRGVFPNQWGLPGGGIELGEKIEGALRREVREEVGLEISQITPWTFGEDVQDKLYDGASKRVYMIYLYFDCLAGNEDVVLNDEFVDHAWVRLDQLDEFDLNAAARTILDIKLSRSDEFI